MNLKLEGRRVVVVGAGKVAQRKVVGLVEAGARVRLVAPAATEKLATLGGVGRIEWRQRTFEDEDVAGALLVFAATDDREVNRHVAERAREAGALVNVVDDPEGSDFSNPAVGWAGPIAVSVSTSGGSPTLAARLRDHMLPHVDGKWLRAAEILGRLRPIVAERCPPSTRAKFWEDLTEELLDPNPGVTTEVVLQACVHAGFGLTDDELDEISGSPGFSWPPE